MTFENALPVASAATLAPSTTPRNFKDAYVQNYNFNVQYALSKTNSMQIGYFGSKGTHLRLTHNLNQPVNGVKPFNTVSATSLIAAGRPLGNISNFATDGISNYNALWLILVKQLGHGLQVNTSYTWSKSLDYNSLSSQGVILQDSNDPANNYGASDFDARNRFVFSGVYGLPAHGNFLISGWQLIGIVQLQSGNPLSVFTNLATNGTAGTIRADKISSVSKERTLLPNGSVQYLPQSICYAATPGCTFATPVTPRSAHSLAI